MQILLGATNAKINEAKHVPSWNEFMCYSTEWIRFTNNSYSVVNTFRVGNALYLYMLVAIVLKQCVLHCMHSHAWCCNSRTLKKYGGDTEALMTNSSLNKQQKNSV